MIKFILTAIFILSFNLNAETEFAEPKPSFMEPRKVVFSIKSAENEDIHHVLSTANNVLKFYGPENINMKIVAYYHGIKALEKKHKDIAVRVDALQQYGVEFIACGNTMNTKKISKDELIENVEIVTAGIAEIIERVQEGWIYIIP